MNVQAVGVGRSRFSDDLLRVSYIRVNPMHSGPGIWGLFGSYNVDAVGADEGLLVVLVRSLGRLIVLLLVAFGPRLTALRINFQILYLTVKISIAYHVCWTIGVLFLVIRPNDLDGVPRFILHVIKLHPIAISFYHLSISLRRYQQWFFHLLVL